MNRTRKNTFGRWGANNSRIQTHSRAAKVIRIRKVTKRYIYPYDGTEGGEAEEDGTK